MKSEKLKNLVLAALLAALACVATMMIAIPIPAVNGYLNLGDAVVLFGAFLLGPVWGMAAGGIGTAMADMLLGYAVYAPGTLVIKGAMAFVAAWLFRELRQRIGNAKAGAVSGFVGECIMVLGYFLYESLVLGYGMAAIGSVAANALQGVVGLVIGTALARAVEQRGAFRVRMV